MVLVTSKVGSEGAEGMKPNDSPVKSFILEESANMEAIVLDGIFSSFRSIEEGKESLGP